MEHVKHALESDKRDPEVWTAWGNIHLSKKEIQNAQKKFEQVLEEAKVRVLYFFSSIFLPTFVECMYRYDG